ncbi:hypothetical protein [Rhodohalobacter sp.]|uniref:hypothetical protein n=1 Tax=Rhodohalobacter sp. TaxID=1974210 RepID=UPI002ACDFE3C|nr:hypothetical protein [Rhodohalobacter sp.]MDZ7756333.1 hypothetical protein [Rhodohalobacter sp.]
MSYRIKITVTDSFKKSYLNNRFIIAGAETSEVSPGYMEGAIHSAFNVYDQIKKIKE